MAEPTSSATVIALPTLGVIGTAFGMSYTLLLIGLAAGLLRMGPSPKMGRFGAFTSITLSALLAGSVGPVAGSMAGNFFNLSNSQEELRICAAVLLGYGWQSVAPVLVDLMKQRLGGNNQQ